ncbi:MAG: hypothetical protein PHF31_06155 [Methylobacter sp.]|nr:hypothetical protein [Methylobacter sp.]
MPNTKPQLKVGFQRDGQIFKLGLSGGERRQAIACFNIKAGIKPGLLVGLNIKKTMLINNIFCNIAQLFVKARLKFNNIHGMSFNFYGW